MKKLFGFVMVIVLVVLAAFAAVKPVDFYATLNGMRSVVEGQPGTFAYAKDNLIVMSWPKGSQWAFVTVTRDGSVFNDLKSLCNGQKCDWRTFTDFVRWLETMGFQQMLPEALPVGMVTTLSGWGTVMITIGARALPNMVLIPAMLVEPNMVATGVKQ
jgi:hypothetical protein